MVRGVVSKVMWVGRATVFLVGLAVILALLFGVASVALAGNGDAWRLGRINVATSITKLGGEVGVNGPMLRLINNNAGTDDTALELQVQSGEAPMKVNSSKKVANLNADKLDGLEATRLAGTGDSVYRGGDTVCGAGGTPFTATLPVSVSRESLLFTTARAGIQANGNANFGTLMNVELRNAANTTTLASTGFPSQAFSTSSTDVRDLVSEGVLKSGISSPSEAPFVLQPGVDYVLRMTVSPNGNCPATPPLIWNSSLSYIQLGTS